MPVTHGAPLGAPTWIDLTTSDLAGAQDFYATVFGWTCESAGPEYGGYVNAATGGHPVAGLMANNPGSGLPDRWTTYFHTADIHASAAAVAAAGGSVGVAPMEVPAQGHMAIAADPAGASFGLWQPGQHRGFEVTGQAGAPVWHQLTTRDFAGALGFYRDVLGWHTESVSDTDDFRYATAVFGDVPLLGVMDGAAVLPGGAPSSWNFFLGADDVDATLELITANGGTVLRAAEDTPFGRLAAVADPTGAAFNLSSLQSGG